MLSNTATNPAYSLPPPLSPPHPQPSLSPPPPPPSQRRITSSATHRSVSSRTLTQHPNPPIAPSPLGLGHPKLIQNAQTTLPTPLRESIQSHISIAPRKTSSILAEWEDVCTLRDDFLTQHARQRSGQELVRLLRRCAQDARAEFMKILNATVARNDFAQTHFTLREAVTKVENAEEALSLQEHDLTAAEGELLILGHRLQQKEKSLKECLGSYLLQEEPHLPELPSSPSASAYSSDSGFSIPDDPMLAQFYSCIGDIKIFRDRLEQLQNSHVSEQEFRTRHRRAGLPIIVSDADFESEHTTQLQTTKGRLHEAKKEARRLGSLCHQQALDLSDAGPMSEVSTSSSSHISSDGQLEIGDESIQKRFPVFFQKSSESLLSRFKNRKDRVNRWLMDVLRLSRLQVVRHRAFTNQSWKGSPISDNAWSRQVWSTWSIESSTEQSTTSMVRRLDSTNGSLVLSVPNELMAG